MTARNAHAVIVAGGVQAPPATLNPWIRLAIGFVLVCLFIFGGGYLAQFIPGARHMAEVIEEHDLRATAIYYTDFKESADGAWYIRHSLEFRPQGAREPR